jgi:hypothetical protein
MDGATKSHKTHVALAPVKASSKKKKGNEIGNDDSSDSSDDSSEKAIGNVAESVMDKAAVSHKMTVAVAPVKACSKKKKGDKISTDDDKAETSQNDADADVQSDDSSKEKDEKEMGKNVLNLL